MGLETWIAYLLYFLFLCTGPPKDLDGYLYLFGQSFASNEDARSRMGSNIQFVLCTIFSVLPSVGAFVYISACPDTNGISVFYYMACDIL